MDGHAQVGHVRGRGPLVDRERGSLARENVGEVLAHEGSSTSHVTAHSLARDVPGLRAQGLAHSPEVFIIKRAEWLVGHDCPQKRLLLEFGGEVTKRLDGPTACNVPSCLLSDTFAEDVIVVALHVALKGP